MTTSLVISTVILNLCDDPAKQVPSRGPVRLHVLPTRISKRQRRRQPGCLLLVTNGASFGNLLTCSAPHSSLKNPLVVVRESAWSQISTRYRVCQLLFPTPKDSTDMSRSRHDRRGSPLTGRVWRRQHANDIVAEVLPVEGMGAWRVCARYTAVPQRSESNDRSFMMLTEAHAAADALAREVFSHACDSRCGSWRQIERRQAQDASRCDS